MAINYNEEEFGLQIPNEGGITDVAFAPGSALDRQINKLNTLEQMGYPQQNLQNLKDMDMKQFKETGTPLSLPADQYAMAISNYDQLFGPKTMTDAFGTIRNVQGLNRPDLYTGMMDQSGNPIRDDIDMQYTDESFNVQPQYTFRDQIADDFGKIKNKIGSGLGSLKDFAVGKGKKGWNLGKQLPGMAMSALTGIPGIGALMGMLPKTSPEQKAMMDLYNSEDYQNLLNQIPGMANYNPVYGMGSGYGLTNAINKRLATLAKTRKRQGDDFSATLRKREEDLKKLLALEAEKDFARIGASGRRPGTSGGAYSGEHRDSQSRGQASAGNTGGYSYDSGGREGYGYGLKYGGRVGYANGGLASLFTRRG